MDVISLHQAGFTNAVASLGTALTDGHAGILRRYTQNVIISYDSDTAGQDAALRAIPKLRDAGISVKVADLSPHKDPDELIKAEGTEGYKERLKNAMNSVLFEIHCMVPAYDLTDPDESTKFFNEVAKRLSYFTDGMEQDNYVRAVSKEFGIDYTLLKEKTKKLALSNDNIPKYEPVRPLPLKKEVNSRALLTCQKMPLVKYFWKIRNTMMMGTEASAEPAIRIPKSVEFSPCMVAIPTEIVSSLVPISMISCMK